MGRVVDFAKLATKAAGVGAVAGPITTGDTKEFAAELVRIDKGKRRTASAPKGSDCYLFTVKGAGTIEAAGKSHGLPEQTFATIEEATEFTVENSGAGTLEMVKVVTPVGSAGKHPGFKGRIAVAERSKTEVVPVPDHKKRIYFCGHEHGAHTERGHAMIVVYDKNTATPLHHHPNAESMFVLLDGACQFTVNGSQVVVKPGEAAYFTTHDKHGLHTAPGYAGASFLEFHIPAAFTTVKE